MDEELVLASLHRARNQDALEEEQAKRFEKEMEADQAALGNFDDTSTPMGVDVRDDDTPKHPDPVAPPRDFDLPSFAAMKPPPSAPDHKKRARELAEEQEEEGDQEDEDAPVRSSVIEERTSDKAKKKKKKTKQPKIALPLPKPPKTPKPKKSKPAAPPPERLVRPLSRNEYAGNADVESVAMIPPDSAFERHRGGLAFVRPMASPPMNSSSARVEDLDYKPPIHLERPLDSEAFRKDVAPLMRFDRYVGGNNSPVHYRAIGVLAKQISEGWENWRKKPAWCAAMGIRSDTKLYGAFHELRDASRPVASGAGMADSTGIQDAPAYVQRILERASPDASDLFTLASGRTCPVQTSHLAMRSGALFGGPNGSLSPDASGFASTYFALETHGNYLRADTSLAFDSPKVLAFLSKCTEVSASVFDQPLAAVRAEELSRSSRGYIHGSCRDIASVLSMPAEMWDRLTHPMLCGGPCRDAQDRPVLVTWTDCCRRIMTAQDAAADRDCLKRPEWGPFYAALMARVAELPLPTLADLLGEGSVEQAERHLLDTLDPERKSVPDNDLPTPGRALFIRTFSALFNTYLCSLVCDVLRTDFSFLVPMQIRMGNGTASSISKVFLPQYAEMRYLGLPNLREMVSASLDYLHNPSTWNIVYRPLCVDWNNYSVKYTGPKKAPISVSQAFYEESPKVAGQYQIAPSFARFVERRLWVYKDDDAKLIGPQDPRKCEQAVSCAPSLAALFYQRSFEALLLLHQPNKARHPRFFDSFPEVLPYSGFSLYPAIHTWSDGEHSKYLQDSGMKLVEDKQEFRPQPGQAFAFIAHSAQFYRPLVERQLQRLLPESARMPWSYNRSMWSDYQCATELEYARKYAENIYRQASAQRGPVLPPMPMSSSDATAILIDIVAKEFEVSYRKDADRDPGAYSKGRAVALCVLYYREVIRSRMRKLRDLQVNKWGMEATQRAWFRVLYYAPKKWSFLPRKGGDLLRWMQRASDVNKRIDAMISAVKS